MSKNFTPRDALLRAIEICGSQAELARRIGGDVQQQHVSYWVQNGLPDAHAVAVEKAVDGEVTCEQLAPNVDWAYLRATKKRVAA